MKLIKAVLVAAAVATALAPGFAEGARGGRGGGGGGHFSGGGHFGGGHYGGVRFGGYRGAAFGIGLGAAILSRAGTHRRVAGVARPVELAAWQTPTPVAGVVAARRTVAAQEVR